MTIKQPIVGVEGKDWWWVCDDCEYSLYKEPNGDYYCHVCGYSITQKELEDSNE